MVCAHMKKNVQKISIAMCIQPLILAPAKSPHPLSQGNDAIQNNNFLANNNNSNTAQPQSQPNLSAFVVLFLQVQDDGL